jgi:hypothetical protein
LAERFCQRFSVSDAVRLCAAHKVPVIAYGTGTSLEGHWRSRCVSNLVPSARKIIWRLPA